MLNKAITFDEMKLSVEQADCSKLRRFLRRRGKMRLPRCLCYGRGARCDKCMNEPIKMSAPITIETKAKIAKREVCAPKIIPRTWSKQVDCPYCGSPGEVCENPSCEKGKYRGANP